MVARYWTSKIQTFEDLQKVQSLGFRGEALASICQMGALSIATRTAAQAVGMSFWFSPAGDLIRSAPVAMGGPGTVVVVEKLFDKFPVRKKMMNTPTARATALRIITHHMHAFGLSHPHVNLKLKCNGVELVSKNALPSVRAAVVQYFSAAVAAVLRDVSEVHTTAAGTTMSMTGLLPAPADEKAFSSTTDRQFFFVNKRHVHMKDVSKQLRAALSPDHARRHPMAVLFFDIPTDLVDVNVTPAKDVVMLAPVAENQITVLLTVALGRLVPARVSGEIEPVIDVVGDAGPAGDGYAQLAADDHIAATQLSSVSGSSAADHITPAQNHRALADHRLSRSGSGSGLSSKTSAQSWSMGQVENVPAGVSVLVGRRSAESVAEEKSAAAAAAKWRPPLLSQFASLSSPAKRVCVGVESPAAGKLATIQSKLAVKETTRTPSVTISALKNVAYPAVGFDTLKLAFLARRDQEENPRQTLRGFTLIAPIELSVGSPEKLVLWAAMRDNLDLVLVDPVRLHECIMFHSLQRTNMLMTNLVPAIPLDPKDFSAAAWDRLMAEKGIKVGAVTIITSALFTGNGLEVRRVDDHDTSEVRFVLSKLDQRVPGHGLQSLVHLLETNPADASYRVPVIVGFARADAIRLVGQTSSASYTRERVSDLLQKAASLGDTCTTCCHGRQYCVVRHSLTYDP